MASLLQPTVPRAAPFTSSPGCAGRASLRARQCYRRPAQQISCAAEREKRLGAGGPSLLGPIAPGVSEARGPWRTPSISQVLRIAAAGALASGLLWLSPSPAEAEVQMVSPQMVTQLARPLPKQKFDKSRVWTVCIGGAVVLFVTTLVAENSPLFPAISKANQAMKVASKRIELEEARAKEAAEKLAREQAEFDAEQRQLGAVEEGLRAAKLKVLGAAPPPPAPLPPILVRPDAAPPASTASSAASSSSSSAPAAAAAAVEVASGTSASEAAELSTSSAAAEAAPGPSASAATAAAAADHNGAGGTAAAAAAPSSSYVVVEDELPDMGAVAWPGTPAAAAPSLSALASSLAAVEGAAAVGAEGAGAGEVTEEDAESLARRARLASFVSDTMAGGKGAMEALRAQRQ